MIKKWQISTAISGLLFGSVIFLELFFPENTLAAPRVIANMAIMGIMFYVAAALVYYKTPPTTKGLLLKVMGVIIVLSLVGSYIEALHWTWLGEVWQVMMLNIPAIIIGMERNVIIVLVIARIALYLIQSGKNLDDVVGFASNVASNVAEETKRVVQENSPIVVPTACAAPSSFEKFEDGFDNSFEDIVKTAIKEDPQMVYKLVIKSLLEKSPSIVSPDKVKTGYNIFENDNTFVQVVVKNKKLARERYHAGHQQIKGVEIKPLPKVRKI